MTLNEAIVEDAALAWLEPLGYTALHDSAIAAYGVRIGTGARFVTQVAG